MALTIEEIKQRHTEGRFVFQLSSEQIKELQQEGFVIIATHNGTCHADDVFACTTIKLYQELCGKKVIIVRTKDPEIIVIADSVVDTGKVYDPEKNRFDHHQEGGAGKREHSGTSFAAFGLVWEKFGELITEKYLTGKGYSGFDAGKIASSVSFFLVEEIDAYDTGGNVSQGFKFGELFAFLRPTFLEREMKTAKQDDSVFKELAEMSELILKRCIAQTICTMKIIDRVMGAERIGDAVLVLDFAVRMSEVSDILRTNFSFFQTVIINQNPKNGGVWTVNIPRYSSVKFPKDWLGKSGEEFAKACGFADVSFCHPEGFTLSCGSKETAIALAQMCD